MSGIMAALPGIVGKAASAGAGTLDNETIVVQEYIVGEGAHLSGWALGYMGGISDGQFAPKGGAAITGLYMDMMGGVLTFTITGNHANNGWTTMKIGSMTFTRAAAMYSSGSGSTSWGWYTATPFSGATAVAEFS